VIRGSPEEEKFAVFYQKDKRLIAVDAINSPKEFVTGKKLIQMQAEIPPELIRNVDVDLKEIVR
jgi:3-phenylpropionate/trans-cinnamate dioxygenase ferredoxin reductase subunit